jgi:phosphatidylglycerol:prolipoprotein diacylglycerol transferase
MHPILFKIGPLTIRYYGVLIATGFLVGLWLSAKYAEKKGLKKDLIYDLGFYLFLGGLIGARIIYILFTDLKYYIKNPLHVFSIWEGGLAIHGAILGGIVVIYFFSKKYKISFLKLADIFSPGVLLGTAIGRIGCFMNGCSYGLPTKLPWGLIYSPISEAGIKFNGQPLHPVQLYESFLAFFGFLILYKLSKKKYFTGYLFFMYAIIYSVIRFFVEFFREAVRIKFLFNISEAQILSIFVIILCIILIYKNKKLEKVK